MEIICKNCGHQFEGNFCCNCGQTAETNKLNATYFWNEVKHGFFYLDSGLFYSLKQLCIRPGHTIHEFVEGKRIRHLKPISLVVILATAYGFLYHYFGINLISAIEEDLTSEASDVLIKINEFMGSHYALISILNIPFLALGSFLGFKKQGYSYVEHLVLNTFLSALRLFYSILTIPFLIYLNNTPYLGTFSDISDYIELIILVWGYVQFFNRVPKLKSIPLSFLSYAISLVIPVILALLVIKIFSIPI